MAEATAGQFHRLLRRWGTWLGGLVLAASLLFITDRLWRLDWLSLRPHISWQLAFALLVATLLFASADKALSRAWVASIDPDRMSPSCDMERIYARGVLMKYLPGGIFQYVSRHVGGAGAGIGHKPLARSAAVEIGLHFVSSLSVAAACLLFARWPAASSVALAVLVFGCLLTKRRLLTGLALQLAAFTAFAAAAGIVGVAILPPEAGLPHFAGLFLLAWLAGFVVPVAPGGLGIREAALLALAGPGLPPADLIAAVLALRASSILGDLLFGLPKLASLNQKSRKMSPSP